MFRFHPLAIEDSENFGQRPKLDDYDDFVFLVVYGAVPDEDRLVEVHCFYSERFLVTIHRDEAPAFTEVRSRYQKRKQPVDDPGKLLYRIVDALDDSFFPILADFDDRIDELENQTGFFRQNFGWLVRNIRGWPAFAGLGFGTEIATVALMVVYFKLRGWF